MEKDYIKYVLNQIKEAIDELKQEGVLVDYPKEIEIQRNLVKIIVPWP